MVKIDRWKWNDPTCLSHPFRRRRRPPPRHATGGVPKFVAHESAASRLVPRVQPAHAARVGGRCVSARAGGAAPVWVDVRRRLRRLPARGPRTGIGGGRRPRRGVRRRRRPPPLAGGGDAAGGGGAAAEAAPVPPVRTDAATAADGSDASCATAATVGAAVSPPPRPPTLESTRSKGVVQATPPHRGANLHVARRELPARHGARGRLPPHRRGDRIPRRSRVAAVNAPKPLISAAARTRGFRRHLARCYCQRLLIIAAIAARLGMDEGRQDESVAVATWSPEAVGRTDWYRHPRALLVVAFGSSAVDKEGLLSLGAWPVGAHTILARRGVLWRRASGVGASGEECPRGDGAPGR